MVKVRIRSWGMYYVSEGLPIEVQNVSVSVSVIWGQLGHCVLTCKALGINARHRLPTSQFQVSVDTIRFIKWWKCKGLIFWLHAFFFFLVSNLPNVSIWASVPCVCPVVTVGLSPLLPVQRAGPSQAAGGGGGHRGLAEESGLLGPGESWRSGPFLHQRGRRQRLRPARGAQLPRLGGELPHDNLLAPSGDMWEKQQCWQKSQSQNVFNTFNENIPMDHDVKYRTSSDSFYVPLKVALPT